MGFILNACRCKIRHEKKNRRNMFKDTCLLPQAARNLALGGREACCTSERLNNDNRKRFAKKKTIIGNDKQTINK
jgi:hypothetical protein